MSPKPQHSAQYETVEPIVKLEQLDFVPPEPTFVPLVSEARLKAILHLEKKIRNIEAKLQTIGSRVQGPSHDTGSVLRSLKPQLVSAGAAGTGSDEMRSSPGGVETEESEDTLYSELVSALRQLGK